MGWDVPSNIMIIIYGLLFGEGNFEKSVLTAVHYGEDTDCTAGTIASLFGIMYGIEFFEEKWIEPIGRKIVTCSIDPFRMAGRIPATVEELTDRVLAIRETAWEELALTEEEREESYFAKPYFRNIYEEMKTIKYEFPYLNVRVDYCGDPVITRDEPKKIKFICQILPNRLLPTVSMYICTTGRDVRCFRRMKLPCSLPWHTWERESRSWSMKSAPKAR